MSDLIHFPGIATETPSASPALDPDIAERASEAAGLSAGATLHEMQADVAKAIIVLARVAGAIVAYQGRDPHPEFVQPYHSIGVARVDLIRLRSVLAAEVRT